MHISVARVIAFLGKTAAMVAVAGVWLVVASWPNIPSPAPSVGTIAVGAMAAGLLYRGFWVDAQGSIATHWFLAGLGVSLVPSLLGWIDKGLMQACLLPVLAGAIFLVSARGAFRDAARTSDGGKLPWWKIQTITQPSPRRSAR